MARYSASGSIAKVYAKALFLVASERKELESIQAELSEFAQVVFESANLAPVLSSHALLLSERQRLAEQVVEKLGVHPVLKKLFAQLVAKGRVSALPAIAEAFGALVDESKNLVRGTVTTTDPLTEAERNDLSRAFAKKFNKQVVLRQALDKSILGGLVVNIQGLTFDGSLKTSIRRLKETLERQSV
ncbi:MAG: ATP synthase F1 subunit delta [Deltaproteobacteria bacterium]|nr:ATP synthase F1 subunit delta [Deltaproteobacteria bacterium]